jgi:hypothetical protein
VEAVSYKYPGDGEKGGAIATAVTSKVFTSRVIPTGSLASIKFSADKACLSFWADGGVRAIDFIHLTSGLHFSLALRRGIQLLGHFWTFYENLFTVTSRGVELYDFDSARRSVKHVKEVKYKTRDFVYSHENRVVLLLSSVGVEEGTGSPSSHANCAYPLHFQPNGIVKLPKFELGSEHDPPVQPAELTIRQMYGRLFVVRLSPRGTLTLIQLTRDAVYKRATLELSVPPPLHLHIVDSLMVIHAPTPRVSLLYDLKDAEFTGPAAGAPIVPPLPLAVAPDEPAARDLSPTLYDVAGWRYLQPNVIVDEACAKVWRVRLNLASIADSLSTDPVRCVDFLLRRAGSRAVLLTALQNLVRAESSLSLISRCFDMVTAVLRHAIATGQHDPHSNMPIPSSSPSSPSAADSLTEPAAESANDAETVRTAEGYTVISQTDIYSHILLPLEAENEEEGEREGGGERERESGEGSARARYRRAVLLDYIRSLELHTVQVSPLLHELLIHWLIASSSLYQLHQYLQYHVIGDSVHLACRLLSLSSTYEPAAQLALDMLKRLGTKTTREQIVEVLLERRLLLPALRLVRGGGVSVPPVRFLEAAADCADTELFTTYRFFSANGALSAGERKKYGALCAARYGA